MNPIINHFLGSIAEYGPPLAFAVIALCLLYNPKTLWRKHFSKSPLEIIFDPTNPGDKFWSRENNPNPSDPKRNFPPSWEYRVEVKNTSSKTVKNVRVTVEHIGPLPQRPEQRMFDITKTHSYDINPDFGVLVPVVRFDPTPRPGMLALHSALAYGPIKVIATAEDTPPVERIFQFDYQRTPAIFPITLALEPIYKVIEHVAKRINDTDEEHCWEKTRLAIRQAALDDKIKINGYKSTHPRENPGGWSMVRTLIPVPYWELADIGPMATAAEDAEGNNTHTFPAKLSGGNKTFVEDNIFYYSKLHVNWSEVLKVWP